MFGKGRSAVYDYEKRLHTENFNEDIILQHVHQLRIRMPRLGTRKLHYLLVPMLREHGIRLGRDELFDLLNEHKLLIRQRKRKVITTNSRHWMHKYANQVSNLAITAGAVMGKRHHLHTFGKPVGVPEFDYRRLFPADHGLLLPQ